tara:strand:+ start:537 stop:1214 length:678 start_codon:yes stop_codon:yes gene_type:complete
MDLNQLLSNYITNYPILSTLVIFISIIMVIFKEVIKKYFLSFKKPQNHSKISNLKHHDVFNTLIRTKKDIEVMHFYTHGELDVTKTKMCIDFANSKVEVCYKRMHELLEDDLINLSKDELRSKITQFQIDIHNEYIDVIRKNWIDKGINNDDVTYVITLFERFRRDVLTAFEYRINSIFGSTYHVDNFERMLAILEMWSMGIDLLPKDMKETFETMNGKFNKIKY